MDPVRKEEPEQRMSAEALAAKMSHLWRGNQHELHLNVEKAVHATGSVKPEIKHVPEGEWQGRVDFNPNYYQLAGTEQGTVEVTVRFRHLPNKPVAQQNVQVTIAEAALKQQAANSASGVGDDLVQRKIG